MALKERNSNPRVSYIGFLKEFQRDNIAAIEETVYLKWGNGPDAPSKTRVRGEAQTPNLSLLLWRNRRPMFPTSALEKFPEGSSHHAEILKRKEMLERLWPAQSGTIASSPEVTLRAAGAPDLSGEDVLDLTRDLSLQTFAAADFSVEKLLC